MKRPIFSLLIIFSVLLLSISTIAFAQQPKPVPTAPAKQEEKSIEDVVRGGTYLLYGPLMDMWIGRAWCVSENPPLFITAAHCIRSAEVSSGGEVIFKEVIFDAAYIRKPDWPVDERIKLKVLDFDARMDVAILKPVGELTRPLQALSLANMVVVDDQWFLLGNTETAKEETVVMKGNYHFLSYRQDENRFWYFTSITSHGGCSGAAAFNQKGQVVGIIWGHFKEEEKGRHFGLITPIDYVHAMLRRIDLKVDPSTQISTLVVPLPSTPYDNLILRRVYSLVSGIVPDPIYRKAGDEK